MSLNKIDRCPKCNKPLTEEHLRVLANAVEVQRFLGGHVRELEETDYFCPDCFDQQIMVMSP